MSLDARLERAREDYRRLDPPSTALSPTVASAPRRRGPGPAWTAIAAALVLVVGAVVGWAVVRDDGPEPSRITSTPSTTTVAEPAPGDSEVRLAPAGPYEDGQQVTLSVPAGLGIDLWNGIPICASITVDGERFEHCESVASRDTEETSVVVTLDRTVMTVDGARNCAEAAVDCRIAVVTPEGDVLRSERLTFVGPAPAAPPTIDVVSTGPGRFEIRPEGLVVDPSWLDYRDRYPEGAAENGPFAIKVCGVAGSYAQTPDPFGVDRDLWGIPTGTATEPCTFLPGASAAVDPDTPDGPITIEVPRPFQSYGGWADCAEVRCFVVVSRNEVTYANDQSSGWDSEEVASALLPTDADWPEARQPSLTIDTPGPHRAGDEVTVTIAGLADGDERMIGTCRVTSPWGCGYSGAFTSYGNGSHTLVLSDLVNGCGPASCYLELDGEGEGMAPPATAPLDTP